MSEKLKFVIGYDGSDCAFATLADLRRAGLPEVAQAVVLSVAETSSQPLRVQSAVARGQADGGERTTNPKAALVLEEARGLALQATERLQQLFPLWEISAESDCGSPASCILARAGLLKADLIVVGSHGHSALGRLFLGSVSHTVIAEAGCSVRIARSRAAEPASPPRILIGVDGSEGAEAAVQAVASRQWPEGTKARVVTAFELVMPSLTSYLMPPAVKWINEDNEAEQAHALHLAETAAETLRKANLNASVRTRVGNPKHALLKEAEAWQADCIFVGARGLNRLDRFLLGSVSISVATRAHCSVEIVRPRTIV